MRRNLAALVSTIIFMASTGCRPDVHQVTAGDMDQGEEPSDDQETPSQLKYDGRYQVDTPFDLTQKGVLPDQLSPILKTFSELHDDPGKALIDIVIASDIPDVSQSLKELPSWILSILQGLLSETIKYLVYANSPAIDQLSEIAQDVTSIARSSIIKSELTIHTPDQSGVVHVVQKVTGMTFELSGKRFEAYPSSSATETQMSGTLKERSTSAADASISFSGGQTALPVGDLMLASLGPLVFKPIWDQENLRQSLTALIDCEAVGDGVSDGSGIAIVGRDLVVSICKLGLTAIASAVENEFHQLTLDHIQISDANGMLYDVSPSHPMSDRQSDRLAEGVWTWSVNSSKVPLTFVGDRVGSAN
jgi:hypothetical protein